MTKFARRRILVPGAALMVLVAIGRGPAPGADDQLPPGVREREFPQKVLGSICRATKLLRGEAEVGERFYDGRDRLLVEVRSAAGRPDGPTRTWHANGQLRSLETYKAGLLDGPAGAWDDRGRALWGARFVAGTGVLKTFTAAGVPQSECPYRNGLKHGNERRWHANGNLASDSSFKDGQVDGWTRTYDGDGQLQAESLAVPGVIGPTRSDASLNRPNPAFIFPTP